MLNKILELNSAMAAKNCRVVVGLDPTAKVMPEKYAEQLVKGGESAAKALFEYCSEIIDAVADIVPAVKPNSAFFEAYGAEQAYLKVCAHAKNKGLLVIADAKRADIGSTSEGYAAAFLNANSPVDFLTINPYFGIDGVKPFLDACVKNNKGCFVLVKTSNPSSSQIQDEILTSTGAPLYEKVGSMVAEWGKACENGAADYTRIGAVVGATHPETARKLRAQFKEVFFLVPGYGAQGATAADIAVNFDSKGGGAIVNSSRGIIGAWEKPEYKQRKATVGEAARAEAIKMRDEINAALKIK